MKPENGDSMAESDFFSTFRHTIATFSKKHSQDVKDFRQW